MFYSTNDIVKNRVKFLFSLEKLFAEKKKCLPLTNGNGFLNKRIFICILIWKIEYHRKY